MKERISNSKELSNFERIEIVSVDSKNSNEEFLRSELFKSAFKKSRVLKYPCLMKFENGFIESKYYDTK
jgi:hypothetical protein